MGNDISSIEYAGASSSVQMPWRHPVIRLVAILALVWVAFDIYQDLGDFQLLQETLVLSSPSNPNVRQREEESGYLGLEFVRAGIQVGLVVFVLTGALASLLKGWWGSWLLVVWAFLFLPIQFLHGISGLFSVLMPMRGSGATIRLHETIFLLFDGLFPVCVWIFLATWLVQVGSSRKAYVKSISHRGE